MNTETQQIAELVVSKIELPEEEKENFSAIITILMIISITLTLIRVIQECNKKKLRPLSKRAKAELFEGQIKELSIKKSWFTRMTIKKIIKKEIGGEAYKMYGPELSKAIIETAQTLDNNQITCLMEAINV
jgi:hypothetical protein